ncbi:Thioredoxin-like fold [Ostreococcus tauri]|uniref:Thioredoxin-like fold n=1 Tax=Ostreococcus tauri TaxID=70448 RepID=A0A090N3S8_OSTTA|nr:Thioredoxin-like fold [Ostreococcus tauri]CEF98643.1 Thioredoxin-like fold [Ostreococcus tauri]|eukprot:XP_022839392.1 Thioredoxin-like fold [Ostreococcus tauri]
MDRRRRRRARATSARATAVVVALVTLTRASAVRGGIIAKALAKPVKVAFREAREARARGEAPTRRLARWLDAAFGDRLPGVDGDVGTPRVRTIATAAESIDFEGVGENFEGVGTFEASDRDAETDSSEDAERWDRGGENEHDAVESEEMALESDGAGEGMRLLAPETFEDVIVSGDRARWVVAACARSSPTCRALAPELAILAVDSAFTSDENDGASFGVAWVDCSPESARAWCRKRLGVKAVPRVLAIANGVERAYEGELRGANIIRNIRAFALAFAKGEGSCDADASVAGG